MAMGIFVSHITIAFAMIYVYTHIYYIIACIELHADWFNEEHDRSERGLRVRTSDFWQLFDCRDEGMGRS